MGHPDAMHCLPASLEPMIKRALRNMSSSFWIHMAALQPLALAAWL